MAVSLKESLAESANARAEMLTKFGFMPMSILKLSRGALSRSLFHYAQERACKVGNANGAGANRAVSQRAKDDERTRNDMGLFGGQVRTRRYMREEPSIMAAELVEFFAKYYAAPGDTYVDPFMGQGVQMQVAHRLGLHYWGYDLCAEFFRYIDAVRGKIDNNTTGLHTFYGDSKFPTNIPDGVGDVCFTSPPYWDIEDYGDHPEQLGCNKSYSEFLQGMEAVARAWLPKFKPGGWCVVNVNDFRKGGRFYSYHSDTINLFERAGWETHDMWVVEGLISGMSRVFAVSRNERKTAPKVHEYCIVFRRPG